MSNRIILHSDLNNFFASVETLINPDLQGKYVAVCGDPTLRHGIVLAKNEPAKKMGVKTGMTIREAMQRCPELVVTIPHPEEYRKIAAKVRRIYADYTDQVEPFGIDEAWLDVTHSGVFGTGVQIADDLRRRIQKEIGITASVGVSFNKVFAKIGSDYKKPDATTEISYQNFKKIVWPLSVSDLLFVGKNTESRLRKLNIQTIGDLARAEQDFLVEKFGKAGEQLSRYARGEDDSPVAKIGEWSEIKSVGNSTTLAHDIYSLEEARPTIFQLSDSVSRRVWNYVVGKATTVQLFVRNNRLESFTRQCKIPPSELSTDYANAALKLLQEHYDFSVPIRALGVSVKDFSLGEEQATLFGGNKIKQEKLQRIVYELQQKFGKNAIGRAIFTQNEILSLDDEERDHIPPPNGR